MDPACGSGWLGLIWGFLVKSSGALLIAILLAGLLRRQSASLRHFVLSLFLVGLVFLPLFSVLPSGWEMRWLRPWLETRGRSPESAAAAVGGHLLQSERSGLISLTPADRDFSEDGKSLSFAGPGIPDRRRALGAGLMLLWFTGLGFFLSRLSLGIAGAFRLTREGEPLEDAIWQQLLKRFISLVPLRREVDLKSHHRVLVPLTWGFLKPVVIMPADAVSWSEEQRSSALFHELSHVKREDFLILLLVRLSLALYWLNPLTWVVFKMLKKEQEKACDELVLWAGIRPSTYAANLLSFKRAACRAGSPAAAFLGVLGMFGRSQLNDRLASILKQKFAFREVKMKTKVIISALAIVTVAFIGLARPSGASAPYEMGTVAQEQAIGAVESPSLDTPVQESQESQEGHQKKQAEKAEQEKEPQEKAKEKITLGVEVPKSGEDSIEITIIEGDTKKIIRVDKPVIKVIKDEAGKKIVVLSGEKEVLVIKGDDVQLKVKGDKAIHLMTAKPLKLDKGVEIKSIIGSESGGKTIIIGGKPHVYVPKLRIGTIHQEDLQKKIAETQALLKKIEDKEFEEAKLEAQKETLRELKEALEDLRQELEKEEESVKAFQVKVVKPEKSFSVVLDKPEIIVDGKVGYLAEGKDNIITVIDDQGTCTVVFTRKLREGQLEAYEIALEKLKRGLPEGYEVESEFSEKSGTIVLKIKGHDTNKDSREAVISLVKELKEELKK